jgi:UDP-N-acetylglucosamine 4,6-dehydratase
MSIFSGRSILITGGTGSFGRAFTKELLANHEPKKIIIFSRDEFKQSEMAKEWPDNDDGVGRVRYVLGDVRNRDRLSMAFRGVDYVVHAAALKQADRGEYNPDEFVETNINGARNVIRAALDCNVKRVVALSTDKACSPVNLYGATKLCAEKLFIGAKAYVGDATGPIFTAVRYGNVLNSRGSVVPFFKQCINEGKPLPITDSRMTRFCITMAQAIDLVLKAFKAGAGDVLVPKLMAVDIETLAEAVNPLGERNYVGLRPGEKLAEAMIGPDEPFVDATTHYILRAGGGSGFSYTSDDAELMTVSEFRGLVNRHDT